MTMEGRLHFAVRSLPSPSGSLDGAFRVHLLPEHLDQIGLKVGDICEISGGDEGDVLIGYGIAWRAADKMGANPKQKPAKMTDALRIAFNIKEGSHVNISATRTTSILHADKVVLTDITPTEFASDATTEDKRWWWRCGYSLINCEAFASGVTFELSAKKGIKKRFCIESVEAQGTMSSTPHLYYCDDDTKIILNDTTASPTPTLAEGQLEHALADANNRIGGLAEQIDLLNSRMLAVLRKAKSPSRRIANTGILLHGYEGTGKSALLEQMEHSAFRKTVRIDKSELNATMSTNKTMIRSKFDEALKSQPSLVLIDELDQLAPASGELYGDALAAGLARLPGTGVLVVAACRTPFDVYQRLLEPRRLVQLIELPIPDVQARFEILRRIIPEEDYAERALLHNLSYRTHGFTGRDLARLVELAEINAESRHQKHLEEWVRNAADDASARKLLDGAAHSAAASRFEDEQKDHDVNGHTSGVALSDFDLALTEMRPTALREIFFEKPQIQWSDIGGSHAVQERFDRILGWPLQHAEKMEALGLKGKKGVLLYGPPGCSKTLTAQAVASTYDLNFIAVKGAELISMYVGESERSVREIFRKARAAAPCVIFFDEIDSIASSRENAGTKGLNVLTTLLNEMDGFQALKGVLVLAATNRPEILDPAIMRPGRFDSHIYLGPPNHQARREIFDIQMRNIPTEGLDLDFWADATEGYTGAEIVEICQVCKELALERDISVPGVDSWPMVHGADLEEALRQTKKGVTVEMLEEYHAFANR